MPENKILAVKPTSMFYEEAAPLSNGGLTALLNIRKTKIHKGQKVLICGSSGSVDTFVTSPRKTGPL
jgi:NADPH:quinone reductase-like Zn-dependent oxidoreductase